MPGVNPLQANWTELAPKVLALQGAALEQALQGNALGTGWAQQDPVSLLTALQQHPPSAAADQAVASAVSQLAQQDLAAAVAYVDRLTESPRKEAARASLPKR